MSCLTTGHISKWPQPAAILVQLWEVDVGLWNVPCRFRCLVPSCWCSLGGSWVLRRWKWVTGGRVLGFIGHSCFLTVEAMWPATSCSCRTLFRCDRLCSLKLWAAISLRPLSCFLLGIWSQPWKRVINTDASVWREILKKKKKEGRHASHATDWNSTSAVISLLLSLARPCSSQSWSSQACTLSSVTPLWLAVPPSSKTKL